MTKHNRNLPTPGDWIGGVFLAVATVALFVCAGAMQ